LQWQLFIDMLNDANCLYCGTFVLRLITLLSTNTTVSLCSVIDNSVTACCTTHIDTFIQIPFSGMMVIVSSYIVQLVWSEDVSCWDVPWCLMMVATQRQT